MSRRSSDRGHYLDATIPMSHHDTHCVAHSAAPERPQRRSVIEGLRHPGSPRKVPNLSDRLNKRWSSEDGRTRKVEDLLKEVE